jgi:hypothetical protein
MKISEEAEALYAEIARNVVKLAELGYIRPQKPVADVPPFDEMYLLMEIGLDHDHVSLSSANFEGSITSVSTPQKFDVRRFPIK